MGAINRCPTSIDGAHGIFPNQNENVSNQGATTKEWLSAHLRWILMEGSVVMLIVSFHRYFGFIPSLFGCRHYLVVISSLFHHYVVMMLSLYCNSHYVVMILQFSF